MFSMRLDQYIGRDMTDEEELLRQAAYEEYAHQAQAELYENNEFN
jgi:hypothetical protein